MKLKKSLGQHFLHDQEVIFRIAEAIGPFAPFGSVVEVGPGEGALTSALMSQDVSRLWLVELDDHWAPLLDKRFPALKGHVRHEDFLRTRLLDELPGPIHLIGNFPYNISSQIIFKALEHHDKVQQISGMFQKEVAQRLAAPPGSRDYGVISALSRVWYEPEYLFDIRPESFDPPPKVMSGFIRMVRRSRPLIHSDYEDYARVVKAAFSQRRKTLRNSLAPLFGKDLPAETLPFLGRRAETLSPEEFDFLTQSLKKPES